MRLKGVQERQDASGCSPYFEMPHPLGNNISPTSSSDTSSHPAACRHQQQQQDQQQGSNWDHLGSFPSHAATNLTTATSIDAAFTLASLSQRPVQDGSKAGALFLPFKASSFRASPPCQPPVEAPATEVAEPTQPTFPCSDKHKDETRRPARAPSSRFYGVYWCNSNARWKVQLVVWVNGKRTYFLNRQFRSEVEAAACYDVFHIALRGPVMAVTNFPPGIYSPSDIAAATEQILQRHPWVTLPLPSGPVGTHKRKAAFPLQFDSEAAEQQQQPPQESGGDDYFISRSSWAECKRRLGLGMEQQQDEQQQQQDDGGGGGFIISHIGSAERKQRLGLGLNQQQQEQQEAGIEELIISSKGRSSQERVGPSIGWERQQQRVPSCSPPDTPSAREAVQEEKRGEERQHGGNTLQQQQQVEGPLWEKLGSRLQRQEQPQQQQSSFRGVAWSLAQQGWLTTLAVIVGNRRRWLFEQSFHQATAAARAYDIALIAAATPTDTTGCESWPSYDMVDMVEVHQQLSRLGMQLNFPCTCYSLYDVYTMRAHMAGKCPDLQLPLPEDIFIRLGELGRVGDSCGRVAAGGGGASAAAVVLPARSGQQQQPLAKSGEETDRKRKLDLQQQQQQQWFKKAKPATPLKWEQSEQASQQQQPYLYGLDPVPPVGEEQQQEEDCGWAYLREQVVGVHELRSLQQQRQQITLQQQQPRERQQQQEQPEGVVICGKAADAAASYQHHEQRTEEQESQEVPETQRGTQLIGEEIREEITAKCLSSSSSSMELDVGVKEEPSHVEGAGTCGRDGGEGVATLKGTRRLPRRVKSLKALSADAVQLASDTKRQPRVSPGLKDVLEGGADVKDVNMAPGKGRRLFKRAAGASNLKIDQERRENAVAVARGAGRGEGGVAPAGSRGAFPAPYPSRYRRVCWDSNTGRWIAQINVQVGSKQRQLFKRYCTDDREAAYLADLAYIAYKDWAYADEAKLNFPISSYSKEEVATMLEHMRKKQPTLTLPLVSMGRKPGSGQG